MLTVRRTPVLAAAAVAITSLSFIAACGGSSSSSKTSPSSPAATLSTAPTTTQPSAPQPTTQPNTAAAAGAALKVGTPKFAAALTDSTGKAVYLFTADTGTTSTCTGACASAWPPVTTTGTPSLTGGTAKLGTTTRSDGTVQVTYNGHPLYYFAGDTKPGDTNGEGSKAFGAEWYLIGIDGNKIDNS